MKTQATAVVYVADQMNDASLIEEAKRIADENSLALHVLSVVPWKKAARGFCEGLDILFSLSRQTHAEMTVTYSDDVTGSVLRFLQKVDAAILVTAKGITSLVQERKKQYQYA